MPWQSTYVEPDVFLKRRGVTVYCTYKHDEISQGVRSYNVTVSSRSREEMVMKYRVHLFVQVRVEHELDTDTPEDAARLAFESDLDLYRRFDSPGQEYVGHIDEVCLVEPLTDEADADGRLIPDHEWSQWLQVIEEQDLDGCSRKLVVPALNRLPANLDQALQPAGEF